MAEFMSSAYSGLSAACKINEGFVVASSALNYFKRLNSLVSATTIVNFFYLWKNTKNEFFLLIFSIYNFWRLLSLVDQEH